MFDSVEKRKVRKHFIAFGGFFAESEGLLREECKFFEAKSVDSFNAKNPRRIAPDNKKYCHSELVSESY